MVDASGNGRNLTATAAGAARLGQAGAFGGDANTALGSAATDAVLATSADTSAFASPDTTVEMWLKVAAAPSKTTHPICKTPTVAGASTNYTAGRFCLSLYGSDAPTTDDIGRVQMFGDTNNAAADTSATFGSPGDNPLAADLTGDGKAEIVLFRPSNGTWYAKGMNGPGPSWGLTGLTWGSPGDVALLADVNGDRRADLVLFRPSTGKWYARDATNLSTIYADGVAFGQNGDIVSLGDLNGDRTADLVVFRPTEGRWYTATVAVNAVTSALTVTPAAGPVAFGANGDRPVVADYNGDGKADLAVFRSTTSGVAWYINTLNPAGINFGSPGDIPVVADYNGDGKADLGLFRPGAGTWFAKNRADLSDIFSFTSFGQNGDIPLAADFTGDGSAGIAIADLALYRPSSGGWFVASTWGAMSDRSPVIADNRWHHLAWTYTSSAGGQLYVDGAPSGAAFAVGAGALNATTAGLRLEGSQTTVDDVAVYTRALPAGRVAAHAAQKTAANTAAYTYAPDGLRESKTVNGTTTRYVYDAAGSLLLDGATAIVYGPAGPIEQITATTTLWYHTDRQGSTRVLSDSTGAKAASYTYSPWGQVTSQSGAAASLQYTGEPIDPETGFVYLRHRYYDPTTAQFLTRDPLVAQTRSVYGYTNNSPLNATDPSGMRRCASSSGGVSFDGSVTIAIPTPDFGCPEIGPRPAPEAAPNFDHGPIGYTASPLEVTILIHNIFELPGTGICASESDGVVDPFDLEGLTGFGPDEIAQGIEGHVGNRYPDGVADEIAEVLKDPASPMKHTENGIVVRDVKNSRTIVVNAEQPWRSTAFDESPGRWTLR